MISRVRWLIVALVLASGVSSPRVAGAADPDCACCPVPNAADCCCEAPGLPKPGVVPAPPAANASAPLQGLLPAQHGEGGPSCRCQAGTPPASPTAPAPTNSSPTSRQAADPIPLPGAGSDDPLLGLPRDSRQSGPAAPAEGDHPSVQLLRQTSRLRF